MRTTAEIHRDRTLYGGHQATPPAPARKGRSQKVLRSLSASPGRRPVPILARLKLLRITSNWESRRQGRGRGRGGTVQTAWPPSCLYPRFARAPFSVTHASPPLRGAQASALPYSAGARGRLLLFPGLLSRGICQNVHRRRIWWY